MVKVRLEGITKIYGNIVAVDNMTLEIRDGELFTFLGPSGCGKTTTLRLIAGFEYPDKGKIYLDEEDATYMKPYQRGTAMVFQNYALWPHMTVFDNIAYGLKLRKIPKSEIKERVKRVLELVKLEGMENRYPTQLSGGQQQRVALARALVVEPKLLLLDEPLSNLDAKLRVEMREEIKRIQKELGITTIYVTHDQEEALTISDRIAVLNKGKVQQAGTPFEVYNRPRNMFVATFLGRSNVVEGTVVETSGTKVKVDVGFAELWGVTREEYLEAVQKETKVGVVLRPEHFTRLPGENEFNELQLKVIFTMFAGMRQEVKALIDDTELLIYYPPTIILHPGDIFKVYIPVEDTIVLPL
ncbi:MAG: ABC transporter ATP-binding protein [Desulfurococcales archaeon]|nr:ABC transporter ATP-binding protein [Desulfurococcales archaeon]